MKKSEQSPLLPLSDVMTGVNAAAAAALSLLPADARAARNVLVHWLYEEPLLDEVVNEVCQQMLAAAQLTAEMPQHASISHINLRLSLAQYVLRSVRVLGATYYGQDEAMCHTLVSTQLLPEILYVTRHVQVTKHPCLVDHVLPLLAFFHKHHDYPPFAAQFEVRLGTKKLIPKMSASHDIPPLREE